MDCPEQSLRSVRSDPPSLSTNHAAQHRKAKHHGRQTSTLNGSEPKEGLVPVILSTDRLLFHREEGLTENALTLYNPFDFEIGYKLYTTAPRKYTVRNGEGSVKPHFCVDIAITRRFVEENVTGFADNFQIKIFSNQACIGKKDIPVFLNTSEESLQTEVSTAGKKTIHIKPEKKGIKFKLLSKKIQWLSIALTTVSLAVLAIPMDGWPSYNLISYNHKLIAAFFIGFIVGRYWR